MINENAKNQYGLEVGFKSSPDEYTTQASYIANGYLGIMSSWQDVYWSMYDTTVSPYSYTGSENTDATGNQIPLNS